MKSQIFKLQRALHGKSDFVLAYNQKKTICSQFPMGKEQMKQVFRDEFKVFWKGRLKGTIIHLDRKLPDQGW